MNGPRVTVVVSTFDRPDALRFALRSLARQTLREWAALVVGDRCDGRTAEAVASVGDPRVRYVNLPERCGDQSGPNSIGAAFCRSPFLAFLNHDDVLLQDHLAHLLARLEETGAEFALGRSYRVDAPSAEGEPRFVAARAGRLTVFRCFPPANAFAFEPVSGWLLRTEAYRRVGDWADAWDLHRPPFNDWLLRACRAGLTTCAADRPTVVHPLDHNTFRGEGGVYRSRAAVQAAVDAQLESGDADAFRAWAEGRRERRWANLGRRTAWYVRHFGRRPATLALAALRRLLRPVLPAALAPFAALYAASGLDAYSGFCRALGRRRGDWKKWMLAYRTGSPPPSRADRSALLAAARAALGEP